ncbi:MAG TPA: PQQ-binding-like beta-propeller repeat protein [Terriglobia bacterium]|nr:PQQ-binding-like beta-propeller repeat protein [Terriglobia bacterium]
MSRVGGRFFKPTVALGAFGLAIGLLAGLNVLISGIPTPGPIVGVVDDWTHHHVVFTNPGTAAQALAEGRFEQWYKIVNDPRYIMQQMKRNPMQRAMATAADFASRMALLQPPINVFDPILPNAKEAPKRILKKDWNVNVGPIGVGSGNFPAKYSFNFASSCSDLAVFNTSVAGSATSATVMGITNLYGGAPAGELNCSGSPTVAWAYKTTTGDKITTSVVFSFAGTEIAFIGTDGTSAYLNLLRFESTSGNGTAYGSPVAPATISTTGSNYVTCKAGSGSCLLRLKFTVGNDTISSPYYDYTSDILWVGDSSGNIHAFKPVFNGATGEVGTPWASTGATTALTSPVYDGTYVYVGGANGLMYAFVANSGAKYATSAALTESGGLGITDGALLDVVNSELYVSVGYDTAGDSGVTQISTPSPGNGERSLFWWWIHNRTCIHRNVRQLPLRC